MDYQNAKDLLPPELVRWLQEYIQGGYLYVPVETGRKRGWGARSGSRQVLDRRNRQIRQERQRGASVEELACRYSLSPSAIRKILSQKPGPL